MFHRGSIVLTVALFVNLAVFVINLLNHPDFDIPARVFASPPAGQTCGAPYGGPIFGRVLSANSYGSKPPRRIQLRMR